MATPGKQCPVCKGIYPDADSFCAVDGSMLQALTKGGGNKKKRVFFLFAAFAAAGLLFFNAVPHILRWAGSNFAVSIVGVSFQNQNRSEAIIRMTRDVVEEILGMGAGGRKKLPGHEGKDFSLILSLKNDNIFSVVIHSFHFTFFLNETKIGKGILPADDGRRIGPFEKVEIACPLSLSALSLVTSAGKIAVSGQLRYRIQGEAVITILMGKITYAVDVKGITVQL